MTRLPMALTDGTDVVFLSCNQCERREWLAPTAQGGWVPLPIETVLQRSTKPETRPKAGPKPRTAAKPKTEPGR